VRLHHGLKRWALAAAAVPVVAALLASCSISSPHSAAQGGPSQTGKPISLSAIGDLSDAPVAPYGSTLLANLHGSVQGYVVPGGTKGAVIPATWHGAESILPVITAQPGWIDVRLAQRPNESTAWIPVGDVTLTSSPYKILIDLKAMHIDLFKSDRLIYSAPAGIGTTTDPTPTGQFFVAFFAAPPSSGYGPFVMVSSAHSNTISDWESSGDALMAIHGPLGADAQIGTTGAQVSHGCVRLHVSDLVHFRVVPSGSPIDVVAS
jgi:lipoprotein-anchoring transpeptidase ErfK/SrfK